jgi:glycosyltransferase involved in cell wall biosynthesis
MRFSLILATVGRVNEVERLLKSLHQQTFHDFEIILVDQNPGDELTSLVNTYSDRLIIHHTRAERGLSRARNIGMHHVTGEIVAFPDDDCWYDPDLLNQVAEEFKRHPEWDGITGRAVTGTGEPSSGKWDKHAGYIDRHNIWRRAISFTVFLRRSAVGDKRFDETLGVGAGTPWGAGEETDFLLQVAGERRCLYYDPGLTVNHPEWSMAPYNGAACSKAASYGRGIGRVLRKHGYPATTVAYHLIRPLGGLILAALLGRISKARYHWAIFKGRLTGWMVRPPRAAGVYPKLNSQRIAE